MLGIIRAGRHDHMQCKNRTCHRYIQDAQSIASATIIQTVEHGQQFFGQQFPAALLADIPKNRINIVVDRFTMMHEVDTSMSGNTTMSNSSPLA